MTPIDGAVFDSDWLRLREPVDHRSRPHSLAQAAARWLLQCRPRPAQPPVIVDIGAGRGSNGRYLAPFMPAGSRWILLDQDTGLLEEARTSLDSHAHLGDVHTRLFDLADAPAPAIAGCDLVTASALLDLVSADWIGQWVAACRLQQAALLCAISVNGQIGFHGAADTDDATVLTRLAADQQRHKGLGMALGTQAPRVLINTLAAQGYSITAMPSHWLLASSDAPLAALLLAGWARAAAGSASGRFDAWAARRSTALAAGELVLSVGHVDVLGLPGPDRRSKSNSTSSPIG
ncbi:MAG: class I SAM-dependent methyltransferase [Salinisphaera sp.]|jgi:SAM-dependent methyltransferase|nr:class I SAM-dependent methyltransferase [Salinisphaera sp.]